MELQHYMGVMRRRWWIPALFVLIGLAASLLYTNYATKPVYQASSDLIVNKTGATETGQQQVDQNSINSSLMLINTYKEIIKSPAIMTQVAAAHPAFNLTAGEINNKVSINSTKDTQIITIAVQDTSYERAAQIVAAVSDAFRDRVSTIMKLNNISVLNQPDPMAAAAPINDSHLVLYVFSIVLALLLGFGIAFLLEYLDDTVKDEHDLEQVLGIPLLTKINKIKRQDLKHGQVRTTEYVKKEAVLRPVKEQR